MNIFQNRESYMGRLDGTITKYALLSLFRLAKQLRLKLGEQGYLLDCYLALFFERNKVCSHTLYNSAQKLFMKQAQDLPFQEDYTKLYLLMFQKADEMMLCSTAHFIEEQSNPDDKIRFQELYNQISNLVGESIMEELNEKLKERFLIVPMSEMLAQGMTYDLIDRLTTRDCETNKQMFQLFMDIVPDFPEEK